MATQRRTLPEEMPVPTLTDLGKSSRLHVQNTVNKYAAHFEDEDEPTRLSKAKEVAETYYPIATDFFEYGYGQSFHFGPVYGDPTLYECLAECEKGMATAINARPGMKILDVGCGIGGPLRQIARFSGAHVTGINCTEYQVKRAKTLTKMEDAHLQSLCDYVVGDFCDMDFEDNTFDGAYCLEASCHARDLETVFKEVHRVLKPGALYVDSIWVLTEKYEANNPEHVKIKDGIIKGGGLPNLRYKADYIRAMEAAGLQILEIRDCHHDGDLPWYIFISGKRCMSIEGFRASRIGRLLTHGLLSVLECARVVPTGSTKVHSLLCLTADSLVESGKLDIFSPITRVVAQKPM